MKQFDISPTFENELYVMCRFDEERLVLLIMNNDGEKKQVNLRITSVKLNLPKIIIWVLTIGKNEIDIMKLFKFHPNLLLMDLYFL